MELGGVRMVARLPPLPGTVLQALLALLEGSGGDDAAANNAALVLRRVVETGPEQARRVISTPGFTQVGGLTVSSLICVLVLKTNEASRHSA
jgi:hypothetical protein